MKNAVTTALILASALAASAQAGERLPTIPPAQYTPEQKKAAEDFVAARQLPVFGPFQPLMHSPQVMSLARPWATTCATIQRSATP
jgi:4-carboxymuconolactone decarboxylase